MDTLRKKALREAYQSKPVVGAIYAIECRGNQRRWVKSTTDLEGIRNRFRFAMDTKTCPEPSMRREWEEFGFASFSFHVVEELTKKDTQTDREFAELVKERYRLWSKT